MIQGALLPPLVIIVAILLSLFLRKKLAEREKNGVLPLWKDIAIGASLIALAAALEYAMGRTPTYRYGPVRLWSGNIQSNQNSQQIADPYTFTHITHGILFYGFFALLLRRASVRLRGILTIGAESAWEVFENTDFVINRYRAATISLDYYGDSIINSVFDILACLVGFLLARRLPVWATVAGVFFLELMLALWIRDSLFLNVLMLLYPLRAVRQWQMAQ